MAKRRRKRRIRFTKKFPFIKFGQLGAVTKQDFVAIAGIFCRRRTDEGTVSDFADYFGGQNPRFDRGRFIAATRKC